MRLVNNYGSGSETLYLSIADCCGSIRAISFGLIVTQCGLDILLGGISKFENNIRMFCFEDNVSEVLSVQEVLKHSIYSFTMLIDSILLGLNLYRFA